MLPSSPPLVQPPLQELWQCCLFSGTYENNIFDAMCRSVFAVVPLPVSVRGRTLVSIFLCNGLDLPGVRHFLSNSFWARH